MKTLLFGIVTLLLSLTHTNAQLIKSFGLLGPGYTYHMAHIETGGGGPNTFFGFLSNGGQPNGLLASGNFTAVLGSAPWRSQCWALSAPGGFPKILVQGEIQNLSFSPYTWWAGMPSPSGWSGAITITDYIVLNDSLSHNIDSVTVRFPQGMGTFTLPNTGHWAPEVMIPATGDYGYLWNQGWSTGTPTTCGLVLDVPPANNDVTPATPLGNAVAYPSPATQGEIINISKEWGQEVRWEVLNLGGSIELSGKGLEVPTSNLSGIKILRLIRNDGMAISKKILVQP